MGASAKDELCWYEEVVGEQQTRREMYSGGAERWMHIAHCTLHSGEKKISGCTVEKRQMHSGEKLRVGCRQEFLL